MIDRICDICSEYVDDVWTESIKDDIETIEFSGHCNCINELHERIKKVKNLDKKSVQQVLKELKMKAK